MVGNFSLFLFFVLDGIVESIIYLFMKNPEIINWVDAKLFVNAYCYLKTRYINLTLPSRQF